jgi:hypothetical protein
MTTVADLLAQVSHALLEPVVSTTLGAVVNAGTQTVPVGSVLGIYVGAQLIVNPGGANQEIINVQGVNASAGTIQATFANSHAAGEVLYGPTFPSGQTDHPLWTQAEMLGYVQDVQNAFLLETRCLYGMTQILVPAGTQAFQQPAGAIRVEAVTLVGTGMLYETSLAELSIVQFPAPSSTPPTGPPQYFFQDQTDTGLIGLYPTPDTDYYLQVWYARGALPQPPVLTDSLVVPEAFGAYIRWGVLARALGKDGEARDSRRAAYAQQRFQAGIDLWRSLEQIVTPETATRRRRAQQVVV